MNTRYVDPQIIFSKGLKKFNQLDVQPVTQRSSVFFFEQSPEKCVSICRVG